LPTSSNIDVFDVIDDTTHQLISNINIDIAGQKKKVTVGSRNHQATVVADLPSIDVSLLKEMLIAHYQLLLAMSLISSTNPLIQHFHWIVVLT
jgi:hypothetical protein